MHYQDSQHAFPFWGENFKKVPNVRLKMMFKGSKHVKTCDFDAIEKFSIVSNIATC